MWTLTPQRLCSHNGASCALDVAYSPEGVFEISVMSPMVQPWNEGRVRAMHVEKATMIDAQWGLLSFKSGSKRCSE